jgi:hypothetical protein
MINNRKDASNVGLCHFGRSVSRLSTAPDEAIEVKGFQDGNMNLGKYYRVGIVTTLNTETLA